MPDDGNDLEFHPFADLFPLMEGERFHALVEDIKRNGLNEPIVEYEGKILDGRNRYRACKAAFVRARTRPFKGEDALTFVISQNLHRRDLTESQRAMTAKRHATMCQGQRTDIQPSATLQKVSRTESAKAFGVSVRSVQSAAIVDDPEQTIPELADRVWRGDLTVGLVERVARAIPREEQGQFVNADEPELRGAAKKYARAKREQELAERTARANELLENGERLYSVIYADPPWRFEPYSRDTGMDRAADNHYQTESIEKIKAIKVPAANDAVLFMWATAPLLPEAIDVMKAWGFTYRSNCIWAKPHAGTGYWFRSQHEQLLVGTKGKIPAPAPGEQFSSLIEAPLGDHSVKPEAFAEMIEEMFPTSELVELFARRDREGWSVWGNEAPEPTLVAAE